MPYIDYGSTVAVCVSHWGSYCNIEAARSPLLYRRSWLLSLGTPEQNFPGLSQMTYDTFTYVKLFVCLYLGEEIPITVLWRTPDKESKSSPYHYSS